MDDYGEDVDFSGNKSMGFKDIVLNHIRRILVLSAVEYRGGFYSSITMKDGEKEIYHQDTREMYSNSILSLAILLEPKFKSETKEAYKTFNTKLNKLKQDFIDASSVEETVVLGESFYSNLQDKILLETFKQNKLQLFHILFAALSVQIAKMNYFETGAGSI